MMTDHSKLVKQARELGEHEWITYVHEEQARRLLSDLANAVEQLQLELKTMTGNRDRGDLVNRNTLAEWSKDRTKLENVLELNKRLEVEANRHRNAASEAIRRMTDAEYRIRGLTDGIRELCDKAHAQQLLSVPVILLKRLLDVNEDDRLGDRLATKHGIGEKPDAQEHIDFITGKRVAGDDSDKFQCTCGSKFDTLRGLHVHQGHQHHYNKEEDNG